MSAEVYLNNSNAEEAIVKVTEDSFDSDHLTENDKGITDKDTKVESTMKIVGSVYDENELDYYMVEYALNGGEYTLLLIRPSR